MGHLRVEGADSGNDLHEQVRPLAVHKAADDHDGDHTRVAAGGIRGEHAGIDRVGNDGNAVGGDPGAEHGVLAGSVRNADAMVDVREGELEHLVHVDAPQVREAVEGVVGEDGAVAESARVEQALVAESGEGLVAVQDGYPLANEDGTEEGEGAPEGGEGVLEEEREAGGVVDFEAVGHPPDTRAVAIGVGENHDLGRRGG